MPKKYENIFRERGWKYKIQLTCTFEYNKYSRLILKKYRYTEYRKRGYNLNIYMNTTNIVTWHLKTIEIKRERGRNKTMNSNMKFRQNGVQIELQIPKYTLLTFREKPPKFQFSYVVIQWNKWEIIGELPKGG